MTSAEGMALRLLPVLLIALVLTAWQYRWPQVVLVSLATAALDLGLRVLLQPLGTRAFHAGLLVTITQTTCFLVIGYFISRLMTRLRQQQAALAHHASMLEELTISRERNRMARELHDTLAHTLTGLTVQLETAKAYSSIDAQTTRELLETALEATRSGLGETRRALKALRATPLQDLGLRLGISEMAAEAAEAADLRLELAIQEEMPALPPDIEQCVYRIAQEAIANVAQHAGSTLMRVAMICESDVLTLTVADDGRGFNTAAEAAAGHYGLAGMIERSQLLGGRLEITSRPGEGTTVRFAIGV